MLYKGEVHKPDKLQFGKEILQIRQSEYENLITDDMRNYFYNRTIISNNERPSILQTRPVNL